MAYLGNGMTGLVAKLAAAMRASGRSRRSWLRLGLSGSLAVVVACSPADDDEEIDDTIGLGNDGSGGATLNPVGGGNPKPAETVTELPSGPGWEAAEGAAGGGDASSVRGGYRVVGPLADFEVPTENTCSNILRAVVRDFDHSHVDFGAPKDPQTAKGMVAPTLGEDLKPVPTGVNATSAQSIGDWYANLDGVNEPYVFEMWLEPQGDGTFVFDSSRFFPLDEWGPTNANDDDGVPRNFGFTTELHTTFEYKGGEVFTFRGDDDVFVFINGQLQVDLGGVHGPQEDSIILDSLGLTVGEVYSLDLFQAERNPTGSNFRIETSLDFTDCGFIAPSDVK